MINNQARLGRRRSMLFPAVAVVAIAIVLSGCRTGASPPPALTVSSTAGGVDNGIADMSVADIAARAAQALTDRSPLHVKGFVSDSGHRVDFDIHQQDAHTATCTLTAENETVDIIRIAGFDYAKASNRYWKTIRPGAFDSRSVDRLVPGTYVRASQVSLSLWMLTKFLDIPKLVLQELTETDGLTSGGRQLVDGVPTVMIVSEDLGAIYIATQGPPDVVRVVSPDGPSTGVWDFSADPAQPTISAPPADRVVDIATLKPARG